MHYGRETSSVVVDIVVAVLVVVIAQHKTVHKQHYPQHFSPEKNSFLLGMLFSFSSACEQQQQKHQLAHFLSLRQLPFFLFLSLLVCRGTINVTHFLLLELLSFMEKKTYIKRWSVWVYKYMGWVQKTIRLAGKKSRESHSHTYT